MSDVLSATGPGSVKVPGFCGGARIVGGRLSELHVSVTGTQETHDMPESIRVQVCECGYAQFVPIRMVAGRLEPVVDDFQVRSASVHWRVCGHIPWCDAGHYSED